MTKVLVVDGNPLNMELALEILGARGFTADGAMDGVEAIKIRKLIKSKPLYKHVPVIALTACAMEGNKERLLAEGFND